MREMLKSYVKQCFRAVYGSKELKELRAEVTRNALDRYDEEIAKGASAQEAYNAAKDSLGDLNSMLAPMTAPLKKRAKWLAITIPLTVLLVVLAVVPFFLFKDMISELTSSLNQLSAVAPENAAWINKTLVYLTLILVVPPVFMGFGMISLACGIRKKALSIVSLSIGGAAFIPQLIIWLFILILVVPSLEKSRFDLRKDIENIKSVEIVEVVETGRYEDDYQFKIIKEVAPEDWEALLSRVAELRYVSPAYGSLPEIHKGHTLIYVRYRGSVNGRISVLIGTYGCGYGERVDSRVIIAGEPCICDDTDQFNSIIDDFS